MFHFNSWCGFCLGMRGKCFLAWDWVLVGVGLKNNDFRLVSVCACAVRDFLAWDWVLVGVGLKKRRLPVLGDLPA